MNTDLRKRLDRVSGDRADFDGCCQSFAGGRGNTSSVCPVHTRRLGSLRDGKCVIHANQFLSSADFNLL